MDEALDAGVDQVVLVVRVCGRGKASGVPVEHQFGQIWTVSNGTVQGIVSYTDPNEALEAAGLSE